jgi:hypothetical protein
VETELGNLSSKFAAKNITEARQMLKTAIKDVEVSGEWTRVSSKTANKTFPSGSLPYRRGVNAYEGVLKNNEVFYRVYSDNIARPWLIKFDPTGMSSSELKNILALPATPSAVAKVTVPAGTKVRVGNIGEIDVWGKGGATQWEILSKQGNSIAGTTAKAQLDELGIIFEKNADLK